MAKFAILSVVLGTPFGLAVYTDVTAEPPPPVRSYADDFGSDLEVDDVDELDVDDVDYDPAELDDELSLEERLVESLGYAPTIIPKDDFDDFADLIGERSEWVLDDGSRSGTTLTLNDDVDLLAELTTRWGDARGYLDAGGGQRYFWFNEEDGVRASLDTGEDRQRLALRSYGATTFLVDEAMASVGEAVENLLVPDTAQNPLELTRPPTEFSETATRVLVHHAKGKVTGYHIEIELGLAPAAWTELLGWLSDDHGPATPSDDGGATVYRFEQARSALTVRRDAAANRLVILVGDTGARAR
jgi:hypothetical protein